MPTLSLRYTDGFIALFSIAYGSVFFLGLIGNSLVVYVVGTVRYMRTTVNWYIVNLAMADIMLIVVCLPTTLLEHIFREWILGSFMCKLVPFLQGVSVSTSVNTLTMIAVDRFVTIYSGKTMRKRRAALIIGCIWIVSILLICPWFIYFEEEMVTEVKNVTEPGEQNYTLYLDVYPACNQVWSAESQRLYYTFVIFVFCYCIPVVAICLCYSFVVWRIWRRESPGLISVAVHQRSRIHVLKMLVAVTMVFIFLWLPFYVFWFIMTYTTSIVVKERVSVLMPIVQWLGSANSSVNPIIYCYYSKKFRSSFMATLRKWTCTLGHLKCCKQQLNRQYSFDVYLRSRQNEAQKRAHQKRVRAMNDCSSKVKLSSNGQVIFTNPKQDAVNIPMNTINVKKNRLNSRDKRFDDRFARSSISPYHKRPQEYNAELSISSDKDNNDPDQAAHLMA